MAEPLFTPEQAQWIMDSYGILSYDEMRSCLWSRYGRNISISQLKSWFNNNKSRRRGVSNPQTFTEEKIEFLRENVNKYSKRELTMLLNERFKCHHSVGSVYTTMKSNRIRVSRER